MRKPRVKKAKTVSYELIQPDSVVGYPMYGLLNELVEKHHEELIEARIALAWCTSWKPDADGNVVIGKCKKASDLDRELAAYDFIILLSRGFWRDYETTDLQRRALLDHELCHAARKYDQDGEPSVDARGRPVFRVRKHDIEEFRDVVERYGTYKRNLEMFAAALRRRVLQEKFAPCDECRQSPGWVNTVNGVKRCECWQAWIERRAEMAAV